jgi:hypothetical protein
MGEVCLGRLFSQAFFATGAADAVTATLSADAEFIFINL